MCDLLSGSDRLTIALTELEPMDTPGAGKPQGLCYDTM